MKKIHTILLFALAIIFSSATVSAQEALKPKPSPLDMAKLKVGETYIKVVYGRPHKNDRKIFGELVPYGQVWRTGANESTEITTTREIEIGGKRLPAGTYALYSIPGEKSWTIILNNDLGQWGSYRYQESLDMLRFDVKPEKSDKIYEPFTILLQGNGNDVTMSLIWDDTRVNIPIKVLN